MLVTLTVLALAVLMMIVERLKPGRTFRDLPLWDMLFGTFRNPRAWDAKCGFAEDRELRIVELLGGREVNA